MRKILVAVFLLILITLLPTEARWFRRDWNSSSYLQLDEKQLLDQWKIVREAASLHGIDVAGMEEAAEDANIPQAGSGDSEFGTPRDLAAERSDPEIAGPVCQCMVDELLFGMTKGIIPYAPNKCHNNCYEFDAGPHGTPIWYQKQSGHWYWSASEPDGNDYQDVSKGWSRTNTFDVSGFWWSLGQKIGVTDLLPENKFLIRLIEDFNPDAENSIPEGTDGSKMDSEGDLEMCLARNSVTDGSSVCLVKKSACMKNIVTRYFQYADVQAKSIERYNDRGRRLLDFISMGLDLLGMIEPFGFVFDLLNAGLSFAREHWLEGALSLLAAVPGLGQVAAGLKLSGKLTSRFITNSGAIVGLFRKIGSVASQGWKAAKGWLIKLGAKLKTITQIIAAGTKVKLQWLKIFRTGAASITKAVTGTAFYKAVAEILQKAKRVFDELLDALVGALCKMDLDFAFSKVLEFFGKMLEWAGLPFGLKETGEWLQAVAPCLIMRCSASSGQDTYNCILHMAFESFKKVMAEVDPDRLEAMGEYDPYMFSNVEDLTEADMAAHQEAAVAELSDEEACSVDITNNEGDDSGTFTDLPPFDPDKEYTPLNCDSPNDDPRCEALSEGDGDGDGDSNDPTAPTNISPADDTNSEAPVEDMGGERTDVAADNYSSETAGASDVTAAATTSTETAPDGSASYSTDSYSTEAQPEATNTNTGATSNNGDAAASTDASSNTSSETTNTDTDDLYAF